MSQISSPLTGEAAVVQDVATNIDNTLSLLQLHAFKLKACWYVPALVVIIYISHTPKQSDSA